MPPLAHHTAEQTLGRERCVFVEAVVDGADLELGRLHRPEGLVRKRRFEPLLEPVCLVHRARLSVCRALVEPRQGTLARRWLALGQLLPPEGALLTGQTCLPLGCQAARPQRGYEPWNSLTSPQVRVSDQAMAGSRPEDRKSTRLNSSHIQKSRMPSSA